MFFTDDEASSKRANSTKQEKGQHVMTSKMQLTSQACAAFIVLKFSQQPTTPTLRLYFSLSNHKYVSGVGKNKLHNRLKLHNHTTPGRGLLTSICILISITHQQV